MSVTTQPHLADIFGAMPEKVLARAAGVHPKTAGRWKRAESMPGADDLMRLMANSDDVFLSVLRHIGRADHASRVEAHKHLALALAALGGRA